MIISFCSGANVLVDWLDFIREAHSHGWTRRTTETRIKEAILDNYGPYYWKDFEPKFDLVLCTYFPEG